MVRAFSRLTILTLLAGIVLLPAAPAAASVERNKAQIRHWLEDGDNKGNLAVADEVFAPNVVMYHPLSPEPLRGVEVIKAGAQALRHAFPDNAGTIEDVIGEGDRVTVRWTLRGTHQGEFMGVAPTHKPVAIKGISIYRFEGGKIVEAWYVVDMLGFYQQIGVAPPIPAARS